jgi:hypothetical protein
MPTVIVTTPHHAQRAPYRRPGCDRDKILGGDGSDQYGGINEREKE